LGLVKTQKAHWMSTNMLSNGLLFGNTRVVFYKTGRRLPMRFRIVDTISPSQNFLPPSRVMFLPQMSNNEWCSQLHLPLRHRQIGYPVAGFCNGFQFFPVNSFFGNGWLYRGESDQTFA
jgi:hypothetical protein